MNKHLKLLFFYVVTFLIIIFIPIIVLQHDLSNVDLKNKQILVLLIVYPFYSLILGFLIYILDAKLIITLVLSSVAYVSVFYSRFNESAMVYLVIYAVLLSVVYTITYFINIKLKNMKIKVND